MDIGRAFSYVTEDEEWVTKILLGGLISLIPIVGTLALIGYMLKTAQNVARGNPRPLPRWGEFGDLLLRGFYGVVISLAYSIPYIAFTVLFSILTSFIGAGASSDESSGLAAFGGVLACIFVPLILIIAITTVLFVLAAYARYVATDTLSEAFNFGEVFTLVRTQAGTWLMLLLVGFLAGLAASLGLIACFIGIIFTSFYSYCVLGHALGQVVARNWPAGSYDAPTGYTPPPTAQF